MKVLQLIIILTLLSGCLSTQQYHDRLNSVAIGDNYQDMLNKIGYLPQKVTCLKVARGDYCTAMYTIEKYRHVFYKFDNTDTLTSIYF